MGLQLMRLLIGVVLLIGLAQPCQGAIAVVDHQVFGGTANSVTATMNCSGGNGIGGFLASYQGSTRPTIANDSQGNTWNFGADTEIASETRITPIYASANPSLANGMTITASGTSSFPAMYLVCTSGSDTATWFDQQNGAACTGAPTSCATGNVTPTNSGALVLAGFTDITVVSSVTNDNGFSAIDGTAYSAGNHLSLYGSYLIHTSGAIQTTYSWTTGANVSAKTASFNAAAGGGGGGAATSRNCLLLGVCP